MGNQTDDDFQIRQELIFSKIRSSSSSSSSSPSSSKNDDEALYILLSKQVQNKLFNINSRNLTISGRTLLHEASANGNDHLITILVEKMHANIHCRTYLGEDTPLHLAVSSNHRSTAFLLLNYGADPNVQNKYFKTPLFYAKRSSIVTLLCNNGALVAQYKDQWKDDEWISDKNSRVDARIEQNELKNNIKSRCKVEEINYLRNQIILRKQRKKEYEIQMKEEQLKKDNEKTCRSARFRLDEYKKWRSSNV